MKRIISYLACVCIVAALIPFSSENSVAAKEKNDTDKRDGIIAYANFGEDTETKGMKVWIGGSTKVEPDIGDGSGEDGWLLSPDKDETYANIYVDIDDDICYGLADNSNYEVEVDYYEDNILGSITLEYYQNYEHNTSFISTNDKLKTEELDIVETQDTYSTRTKKWFMPRPSMTNALSGADFKFGINSSFMGKSRGRVLIQAVRVRRLNTRDLFEISAESDNYGNIFYTGDKIKFNIGLRSKELEDNTGVNINIKVSDENQNVCLERDVKDIYKKKNQLQNIEVELNEIDKYNYYMMDITVTDDSGKAESRIKREFSYVRSFRGENLNPTLGINLSRELGTAEDDIKVVKYAGFSGIREFHTPGLSIGAGYGSTNQIPTKFSPYVSKSTYVSEFAEAGLDVLIYFGFGQGKQEGRFSPSAGIYSTIPEIGDEVGLKTYCDAQMQALDYYNAGTGVAGFKYFQIDNEVYAVNPRKANHHTDEMAEVHKMLYPMIKEKYPDVTVVTNGAYGSWKDYGRYLNEYGTLDYTDAVGVHCYTQSGDPITYDITKPSINTLHQLQLFRKGLDESGHEDVKILATEWGYSSRKYQCPSDVDGQKAYIVQNYMLQRDHGLVDYSILFQLSSYAHWQSGEHQFGICRSNTENTYAGADNQGWVIGAAKPAYVAMANLNCMMYDHEFISRDDISEDTVVQRWYKTKENKDMLTFFTRADCEQVNVDLGTDHVTIYDINGNATEVYSVDGKYSFEAMPFIKYVVGNFTKYNFIDNVATGLETNRLTTAMNKNAVAKINNGTGKDLKLEVITNSETQCSIEAPEVAKPGETKVVITAGDYAITGDEDITFRLVDDEGKIYYNEGLVLRYEESLVTLSAESYMLDETWHLKLTIVNNTDSELDGTIEFDTRQVEGLFENTDIVLAAREEKMLDLLLSKPLPDGIAFVNSDISFVINDVETATISKRIDFTLIKKLKGEINIDGDLSDWNDASWITLDDRELCIGVPNNPDAYYNGTNDISGNIAFKWDEENFYFAADVLDDVRYATGVTSNMLWSVDNIQLGIVYDPYDELDITLYEELSFGSIDGVPAMYRHYTSSKNNPNPSIVEDFDLAVKEAGEHTYYELKIPWNQILSDQLSYTTVEKGSCIRIGTQFNDNDGKARKAIVIYGWENGAKQADALTKYYITE